MIPLFKVFMADNAPLLVEQTLRSGYIGEGPRNKEFEGKLESLFGRKVHTVNSCTTALDLALHMIGVKEGDEVITTPITCTATNSPIVNRGAIPVWADVNPTTGLIDSRSVKSLIGSNTKAIMAVNWGGHMPNYRELKSFGLPVIEDAAHGPYWTHRERGDYIAWSFQAIKHLTTGDGGALAAPDMTRVRLLRWYGLDRESSTDFRCSQNIREVGYKAHMNDIAASIGLANIEHLETIIQLHNDNAAYYDRFIADRYDGTLTKPLYTPDCPFWLYTLVVRDRDAFIAYLTSKGIASSMVHARNDTHDAFRKAAERSQKNMGTRYGVEEFNARQVSIPVGWWLTPEERSYIVETVNKWSA